MVLKRAFRKVLTGTSKITKAIHSCLKATILVLTGLDVKSCIAVKRYLSRHVSHVICLAALIL